MADKAKDVGEALVGAFGMFFDLLTPLLRPRRSHWGLDEETASRRYPGDDLIANPKWSWTHGVEIDAPAEAVWRWVVQIGQDRAGFYSYQFLENLAGCQIQNADIIHPEWQSLRVGEGIRIHPKAPPLPIVECDPGRWFVAHSHLDARTGQVALLMDVAYAVSWLFFVEPLAPDRCRFISRFRSMYDDAVLSRRLKYGPWATESVGFVMDRRMLLGVKERAERERRRTS